MDSEHRSPLLLVGSLCLAGVVAMLAVNQNSAGMLYAAPSTAVSSQTTVVPALAGQMPVMASMDADFAEPVQQEDAPVDYEVVTEVQGNSWNTMLAGLCAIPMAAAGFFMFKGRAAEEEEKVLISIDDLLNVGKKTLVAGAVVGATAGMVDPASAYPVFAQQGFANPREATGRIVCANCHLASKGTELELPQAVLPDQVFEAVTKIPYVSGPAVSQTVDARALLAQESSVVGTVTYQQGQPVDFVQESGVPVSQMMLEMDVPTTPNTVFKATIKVPYDHSLKQPAGNGRPSPLNVGAVLILPEGFTIAPADRIPENIKEEVNGLSWIKYSAERPNILVVGPVPGDKYADEMVVPLLSPDPAVDKNTHFGTLPVYVGGNRGRGQFYPTGEKSNNNAYEVQHSGKVADIELNEKTKVYSIAIAESNGLTTNEELPAGAELIIKKGDVVEAGQLITTNPNVGGFGQAEGEIVLQDPGRVKALLFFLFTVLGTQTALVIKKKQYEQVQLSEMNF